MSVNINYHSYYCTRAFRVDRANKYDIENDRRCSSVRENDLRETVVLPPPRPEDGSNIAQRVRSTVRRIQ